MRLFLISILVLCTGCLSFHQGSFPDEPDDLFMQVSDTRVRYVDVGEGPAVVLLHGFAASLNTWDDVIPELAKNHRVLALDLRGFGYTDRPETADYSPQAQADLVFQVMNERGIDQVSIVAHSWGSSVALAMALEDPVRIRRLALYDAWVYEEQLPTFFLWSRASGIGEALFSLFYKERPGDKIELAFYDRNYVTQALVDETREALHRPGAVAAALKAVRGQRFEEVEDQYSTIAHPTLIMWGREDGVTRLSAGERLARDLPNAELVVFAQCGHFPMIEAREASNRRLVDFLAPDLETENQRADSGGRP